MLKRLVFGIMFLMMLIGMLTLARNIQPAKAEPTIWTVDDDGPADFHTIQEAVDAASPGDTILVKCGIYYENVEVNKHNVSLLGENRETTFIDGNGTGQVVVKIVENHVTVCGFTIKNSEKQYATVQVAMKNHTKIINNIMTHNTSEGDGVALWASFFNTVSGNTITNIRNAVVLIGQPAVIHCSNNTISRNIITNNTYGVYLHWNASNNIIYRNTITNNSYGVYLDHTIKASNNKFYHNDFINNTQQVRTEASYVNIWDDDYPSGGNYWSDYTGVDLYSGPYQNKTGSDGIGDTAYVINANNTDRYPFMNPRSYDVAVVDAGPIDPPGPIKTIVCQGYSVDFNATVENQGDFKEAFNVTLKANTTVIGSQRVIDLPPSNTTSLNFTWSPTNTTLKGNYTITAIADNIPGETDTADNIFVDGWILITIPGDITGDFAVNFLDAILLGAAFNSQPGDPNWNPNADINNDKVVNYLDAIILGANFDY